MKRIRRPVTASRPIRFWFIERHNSKAPPVVPVVEDEQTLWILAVGVVEEAAFIAFEVRGADEAAILLESRIDITLLFAVMPGSMDGLKLNSDFNPAISRRTVVLSESLLGVDALVDELRSLVGSPLIAHGVQGR